MITSLTLQAWLSSFRLKTLPLAMMSILLGNALAYRQQLFSISTLLLTLITAILLQILSNLANDYGDAIKGSDKIDRLGPVRGIQQGLISLRQLRTAVLILAILSMLSGLGLIVVSCHNWHDVVSFILLGAVSIIAALTYTMGKRPYGYLGFGDLSVLLFFGLVSVLGSYYLQTKQINSVLLLVGLGGGLLAVAVLNINNLRDIESDRANNKRTIIVLFGDRYGRYYHLLLNSLALICLSYYAYYELACYWSFLFLLTLPSFIRHFYIILTYQQARQVPPLLFSMIKLAITTDLLYCIGIILS